MSQVYLRRLAAVVVLVMGVAYYAVSGPTFHLHKVDVTGDTWVVSEEDVRLGLARSGKMSLLFGDFTELVDQVASMELVRSASYSLDPPNALKLQVQGRKPYARFADGGLVDSYGEWYMSETQQDLPIFSMSRSLMPQAIGFHTDASAVLAEHGIGITQLHHATEGWRVFLSNGWVVLLGEHRIRDRLERFVRAMPQLRLAMPEEKSLRFDMRYPHGLAIAGWTALVEGEENE